MKPVCVLIEDDSDVQELIKKELNGAGFETLAFSLWSDVSLSNVQGVDVILLDLWLPDADGLSLIPILKENYDSPIIVLSAQGDPDTIVRAMRLGADYYLEKPVNIQKLLSILRYLNTEKFKPSHSGEFSFRRLKIKNSAETVNFTRRSLTQSVMFFGLGIHSGKKYGLQIEPGKNGIQFQPFGTSLLFPISAAENYPAGLSSGIRFGEFEIRTVEHLLSALWGSGITDCVIKTGAEIPILDGSAIDFLKAFKKVGITDVGSGEEIIVKESFDLNFSHGRYFQVFPSDDIDITYILELDGERIVARYRGEESYETEIAPARTFAQIKDVETAHNSDLAQGGRFNNFILLDGVHPINTTLRFDNEPARHKILDLLGDLFSLGFRWRLGIVAHKTGHSENLELLKHLRTLYLEEE